MPTDFGIRGGNQQGLDAATRLTTLGKAEARALLRDIETQITGPSGTKTGVLKLVNLSNARHNVRLERKSLLQRMFVADRDSMKTTADTLKDLFEKAGFDPSVKDELARHLENRANRAGTKTIAALIASGLTTVGAESGASEQEALDKLGIRQDSSVKLGKGGFGQVVQAGRTGSAQTRVYKQVDAGNRESALKLGAPTADGKPRLERRGPASSAYLGKNITGVVRPEVYLIKETPPGNAPPVFHAVEGDKNFKTWAALHLQSNPKTQLALAGVLMKAARGVVGMDGASRIAPIEQAALHSAALDGLKTLKQLSANGFVHGDIKPLNMFFDEAAGKVQLIDTDSMKKMRKGQQGCSIVSTKAYSHPNASGNTGFEQDLFGLGLSVLEMSTQNRNVVLAVARYKENPRSNDPGFQKLRLAIRSALPRRLNPTQTMALNWVSAALDHDAPFTDRYGAPAQGQAGEHLLDRVDPAKHSNISSTVTGIPLPARPGPAAAQGAQAVGVQAVGVQAQRAQAIGAQAVGVQAQGALNGAVEAEVLKRAVDQMVEKIVEDLANQNESFKFPNSTVRQQTANLLEMDRQLKAWQTSPEGQKQIESRLQGLDPRTTAFKEELEAVLIDQANLLHLGLYVAACKVGGDNTRFERKLPWAGFEKIRLLTTEELLKRVGLDQA